MRTRRLNATIVAVLIISAVALGTIRTQSRIENVVAPPASFAPAVESMSTDPDSVVFVKLISGPLDTVIGEGTALAELGMSRSRNVIELSIRMERFSDASTELTGLIAATVVPEPLNADIQQLKTRLEQADIAINASISALRTFDWDALSMSVSEFHSTMKECEMIAARLYA